MVSKELIRIAILWHEIWYDALEEASRQYFGARNVEGMFATLAPLHEMMDKVWAPVDFFHRFWSDFFQICWAVRANFGWMSFSLWNTASCLFASVFVCLSSF